MGKTSKPPVFNYKKYTEAQQEIKRLKEVNKKLVNELIKRRMVIDDLAAELSMLRTKLEREMK